MKTLKSLFILLLILLITMIVFKSVTMFVYISAEAIFITAFVSLLITFIVAQAVEKRMKRNK